MDKEKYRTFVEELIEYDICEECKGYWGHCDNTEPCERIDKIRKQLDELLGGE